MKKTCIIAVAIVAMMGISSFIGITNSFEQDTGESPDVLGDTNISICDYLIDDNLTVSEISCIEDIYSAPVNSILEINSHLELESNTTAFFDALSSKIQQGVIVVSTIGSDLFIENDLNVPVVISPDATISAIYYDPITGNTACYSVICDDPNEAASLASSWVDSIANSRLVLSTDATSASSKSGNSPVWGTETTSYVDKVYENYGKVNVRTTYTEQVTDSDTHRYFKAYYVLQSVPEIVDASGRTSKMTIWSDVDGRNANNVLRSYGPTTTVGTSSTSVSLNWGVDSSGGSVGMSASWEYTTPDVTITDQSDYSGDLFKTIHDVDESKNVGKYTYKIEPGTIVSTLKSSNNGKYVAYDNYEVEFCEKYDKLWPWDPSYHKYSTCSFNLSVNIP